MTDNLISWALAGKTPEQIREYIARFNALTGEEAIAMARKAREEKQASKPMGYTPIVHFPAAADAGTSALEAQHMENMENSQHFRDVAQVVAAPPAPPAAECAAQKALERAANALGSCVYGMAEASLEDLRSIGLECARRENEEALRALATPCQQSEAHKLQITEGVIDGLKAELADHEASFDLRWKADMRAIARWREATGRELVLPDHADLCIWLLERGDEAQIEIARLTAEVTIGVLRAELAQARKASEEAQRFYESEERAHIITIDQRDAAEEAADTLAYTIGSIEEIGEHTNLNDPWANAANLLVEQQRELAAELRRAVDALRPYARNHVNKGAAAIVAAYDAKHGK